MFRQNDEIGNDLGLYTKTISAETGNGHVLPRLNEVEHGPNKQEKNKRSYTVCSIHKYAPYSIITI